MIDEDIIIDPGMLVTVSGVKLAHEKKPLPADTILVVIKHNHTTDIANLASLGGLPGYWRVARKHLHLFDTGGADISAVIRAGIA